MIAFSTAQRFLRHPGSVLAAMALAGSLAMAQQVDPPHTPSSDATTASARSPAAGSPATKASERLREGTRLIDVPGTFQSVGVDNFSFLANGNKDSYRVLENLALQRVSKSLEDNRALRQWVISGTITEYRGSNYLLITKAVIQLPEGEAAANP